jgi:hypothetical protein
MNRKLSRRNKKGGGGRKRIICQNHGTRTALNTKGALIEDN